MQIFDLFRSGYNLGFKNGCASDRRKPEWELILTYPQCLLDKASFMSGYKQGYVDGMVKRRFIPAPRQSPYAAFRRDD